MHKRKILLTFIFVLCLTIICSAFGACGKKEDPSEQTQVEYSINEVEIELKVDATFKLEIVSNIPYTEKVSWESENPSVAIVDVDGVVTGKNIGNTRIVSKIDGKTFYTKVTVVENYDYVPELVLDGEIPIADYYEITILKNGYYTVSPLLRNVDEKVEFTMSSSDPSVQVLEGFTIKGVSVKDGVKLTISCEYQSKSYSILLVVNVIGE